MRWNTPLAEAHAAMLLEQLDIQPRDRILDLGCGWGELLIRAVTGGEACIGIGVDTDPVALERAGAAAAARGAGHAISFQRGATAEWDARADRVISVGASQGWDGDRQALAALAELVSPGGRLLFGTGCWERTPSPAARELFGVSVSDLAGLAEGVVDAGWRIVHLSTADQLEWDEFESTWRAGREDWLRANPGSPLAVERRQALDARLSEYLRVYRGVLGFCYLVLAR